MAAGHTTRPLSSDEEQLLYHLLQVDDPRVEPFRQQVPYSRVSRVDPWPSWIEFSVWPDAPPAKDWYRDIIATAHTIDRGGDMLTVTLFMDGDHLGRIEIGWYDREPTRLPRPDELDPPFIS